MYCVNENKDAKAHFAFFFNFPSFTPMKISVADLSAPIGVSVFKFSVHFQVG